VRKIGRSGRAGEVEVASSVGSDRLDGRISRDTAEVSRIEDGFSVPAQLHDETCPVRRGLGLNGIADRKIDRRGEPRYVHVPAGIDSDGGCGIVTFAGEHLREKDVSRRVELGDKDVAWV
jgi:hypothetical protein